MFPIDFILSLGHLFGKVLLVPLLAHAQLRKSRSFEPFLIENIGKALRVSQTQAFAIYKRGVASFIALSVEFFFISKHSQRVLQKKLDATKVIGAEQLAAVFASSRPVLVITMYMGNFPLGFLKLMTSVKSQRKLFVFKFNAQNAKEDSLFALFRRASQNIEPLRAGEEGGKKAFLELRKGNVVAMMVDAEVHVTSRADAIFFNQRCPMQNGPATLAVLTKAVIVPIINYVDSNGQPVVRVEAPLYPDKKFPEVSNQQVIARLTQDIARLMESWIWIDPSQVQRWSSIAQIINRSEPIPQEDNHRL